MTEDRPTSEQVDAMEARARAMLTQAHALSGLIESGCRAPVLFLPLVAKELRCVHVGDGDFRVLAVDSKGEPRTGPRGPMGSLDVAREVRAKDGFRRIGWKE